MRAAEDILSLLNERRSARGPLLAKMEQVRDAYNGDLVVPLPEMDSQEAASVANLFNQGIDAMSQRIASTVPDVVYHPTREGIKASEVAARKKRAVNLGWWEFSQMPSKLSRRARFYTGYGMTPVVLVPDMKANAPVWQIRNPLGTFPADCVNPDDVCPDDTVFAYKRSAKWLKSKYPEQFWMLQNKIKGEKPTEYDIVEYQDCESSILLATAKRDWMGKIEWEILEAVQHDMGVSPAIVLGRATLDRLMGQFEQMLGMYQLQAKMHALEVIAVTRGIFPDQWLVARPNEMPSIIDQADGVRGQLGVVKGGDIQTPNAQPTYLANQMSDRLERYQRLTGGIPAEFGGESTTNVRTGRRGDAILSATVDFRVQEAQRDLARSLHSENQVAIAMSKRFFNKKLSTFVSWKGVKGKVDYNPKDLFDTDDHTVSYANAGSDANGLTIALGQLTNLQLISKETARKTHPMVEDPEFEHDAVIAEALELALLSSVQQQASQGAIPPNDLARIMQLVKTNKEELADAILKAQEEAQARQAKEVPPESPEAQPGLSLPGMGAEAGSAQPAPQDLASLLSSLRRPNMPIGAERGVNV